MKTAEEQLLHVTKAITGTGYSNSAIIVAMKEYAKDVAEQALKDAANKYNGVTMKDDFGCICDVPNAILSSSIETP